MTNPLTTQTQAHTKRFDTDYYVEGYATTFNTPYPIYEFEGLIYYEIVDRNAFDGADLSDVIMQYDHEGKVLARTRNNTLGIEATQSGLLIFADLSKSSAAIELYNEVQQRLVDRMSLGFKVLEDSYNKETRTRTILKFKKVYDVSAVSYPANDNTDISVRSFFDGVIEKEKRDALEREKQLKLLKMRLECSR
ncbi:MAG: HK97 family phage prohead protease [Defluviitaleaceae bacterium]|nr:HK97 family phage prohead protease [Defluviitaleaceae bacterium]